jgi:hypothetical protein
MTTITRQTDKTYYLLPLEEDAYVSMLITSHMEKLLRAAGESEKNEDAARTNFEMATICKENQGETINTGVNFQGQSVLFEYIEEGGDREEGSQSTNTMRVISGAAQIHLTETEDPQWSAFNECLFDIEDLGLPIADLDRIIITDIIDGVLE